MINNSQNLKNHNCNISELIKFYLRSDLSCGKEFCPVSALEPFSHKHEDWNRLKQHLLDSFEANFNLISENHWLLDASEAMSRGNHKSAIKHHDALKNNFTKEIETGFQIPILISDVTKIRGSEVSPVGAAT